MLEQASELKHFLIFMKIYFLVKSFQILINIFNILFVWLVENLLKFFFTINWFQCIKCFPQLFKTKDYIINKYLKWKPTLQTFLINLAHCFLIIGSPIFFLTLSNSLQLYCLGWNDLKKRKKKKRQLYSKPREKTRGSNSANFSKR